MGNNQTIQTVRGGRRAGAGRPPGRPNVRVGAREPAAISSRTVLRALAERVDDRLPMVAPARADGTERLSVAWVISKIAQLADEESEPNPVIRLKALELLGKHTGAFEPRSNDVNFTPLIISSEGKETPTKQVDNDSQDEVIEVKGG